MTYLYPLWLFFAALFFYFAYVHWRQSSMDIRPFQFRQRDANPEPVGAEAEMSTANMEFARDFNNYLTTVNTHNRSRHRAATIGYFVAGVTALASMFFVLFSRV